MKITHQAPRKSEAVRISRIKSTLEFCANLSLESHWGHGQQRGAQAPFTADEMTQDSAEEEMGETCTVIFSPHFMAGDRVEFSRRRTSLGHGLGHRVPANKDNAKCTCPD